MHNNRNNRDYSSDYNRCIPTCECQVSCERVKCVYSQLEIDRYIGLPIFKHFTIIGYRFCKQNYIGFDFFFFLYIHNYTEYNQQ